MLDPEGREHPAQRFFFTDPRGERKRVSSLLALNRDLQLLETGAVAYAGRMQGHQMLLEPGRLRVQDATGRDVVALLPTAALEDEARKQLQAQGPLIDRAIEDHRRWLNWVGWASALPTARRAASELEELQAVKRAVEAAQGAWARPGQRPGADPGPGWFPIFPGVYLEAPKVLAPETRRLALVTVDGTVRPRPLEPPRALGEEDRFLFWVLHRRATEGRDQSLRDPVDRWIQAHGESLGVTQRLPAPAQGPPTKASRT